MIMTLNGELRSVTHDEGTEALISFVSKLEDGAKDPDDMVAYPGLLQIGQLAVEVVVANLEEKHTPRQLAEATMLYVLGSLIEAAEKRDFSGMFPDMPPTPED